MSQPPAPSCGRGRCGLLLLVVIIATVFMLLLVPPAEAMGGLSAEGTYEPTTSALPSSDVGPLDATVRARPLFEGYPMSSGGLSNDTGPSDEEEPDVNDTVVIDHNFAVSTFMAVSAMAVAGLLAMRRMRRDV
jgi:hypothetical protein